MRLRVTGESVASVAHDLDMSDQTIYSWRRQDRMDRGLQTGLSTAEAGELAAAKKRIRELRRQWRADRALRPAMRSPGRPDPSRVVQRQLWRLIATGVTSAEAARVVGVSVPELSPTEWCTTARVERVPPT